VLIKMAAAAAAAEGFGEAAFAAVADLPVLAANGSAVPFGSLFAGRRAIIVFVRHFL
jgi:hypothetical protein